MSRVALSAHVQRALPAVVRGRRSRRGAEAAETSRPSPAWSNDPAPPRCCGSRGCTCATPAVAEDVVQETWLAVVKGIDRFEGRSSLKTWILRILANRARTRGAQEGRSVPFSALASADAATGGGTVAPERFAGREEGDWPYHWAAPPRDWPQDRLLAKETLAVIDAALAQFPRASARSCACATSRAGARSTSARRCRSAPAISASCCIAGARRCAPRSSTTSNRKRRVIIDDITCRELVELVTEYLEETLPAPDRQRFEAHLEGCGACAMYLDQMRETIATGAISPETIDPAARDELISAFRGWTRGQA